MSQPPKKSGMGLYADLLDPSKKNPGTISSAPVKYDLKKQQEADVAAQQKKKDESLKFQPIKRPQQQQKTKPKAPSSSSTHKFSSSTVSASAGSPEQLTGSTPRQQPSALPKSTYDDWVGNEDEDDDWRWNYPGDVKPERGGRKKKKKNKEQQGYTWSWDDIYDPSRPNNYADYKGSSEQYDERRDWKERLYHHQIQQNKKEGKTGDAYSDEEDEPVRPTPSFAPPSNYSFAPPSNYNFAPPNFESEAPAQPMDIDSDDYYRPPSNGSRGFDAPSLPADATGEDAYMARARLSSAQPSQSSPPAPPPPKPPIDADTEAKKAEAMKKIAAMKVRIAQKKAENEAAAAAAAAAAATSDTSPPPQAVLPPTSLEAPASPPPPPPPEDSESTISRAPVRYELPPPPPDFPADEDIVMADTGEQVTTIATADETRSKRPGQKGFAQRMMEKQGWKKGQGLGAKGDGITTALIGRLKNKETNIGKIVGGKRNKSAADEESDDSRFGKISEVIKLEGMLDGLDVQREIEDNNLMQQIGDQMSTKYGYIERLFIWRKDMGGKEEVFVKFVNQMSALRAVNATDGMEFAGNNVVARFFDVEKFEAGDYA